METGEESSPESVPIGYSNENKLYGTRDEQTDTVRQRHRGASNSEKSPPGTHHETTDDGSEMRTAAAVDILVKNLEEELSERVTSTFREVVGRLKASQGSRTHHRTRSYANGHAQRVRGQSKDETILPEKMFIAQQSILTQLFEFQHVQTVYNIFVAILIIFSLQTLVHDVLEQGRLVLEFELMIWAFGNLPRVVWVWLIMQLSAVSVFPLFQIWSTHREKSYLVDVGAMFLYVAFITAFFILPIAQVLVHELPPASAMIVVSEQVRLIMKAHAFVRENVPKFTSARKEGGLDFSKYLYFLFAPTLVYRDQYPRSPSLSWRFVASNILQVLVCIFYTYYIFERFCKPVFENFNRDQTLRTVLMTMFGCMLPGTLLLLIGFFAVLHSWMNAFAEMLTFSDRLFYKDWWNSTSFGYFYRTWNIVVHDWLYTYVYKDLMWLLGNKKHRPVATALVFFLSAFVHEYVMSVALGFVYPVLLLMFGGVGLGFMFMTNNQVSQAWNVFMWVMLFMGTGLLMSLYSMEWYARVNCKVNFDSALDYFVPRSWTCM